MNSVLPFLLLSSCWGWDVAAKNYGKCLQSLK